MRSVVFLLGLLLPVPSIGARSQAVVTFTVAYATGAPSIGTGFFISRDAQIVTAYHVVREAVQITVIDASGARFEDPIILAIAPSHDLATLQIASEPTTYLPVLERIPEAGDRLQMLGNPLGLFGQSIEAIATSRGLVSSDAIRSTDGRRLFRTKMSVIPIDATIFQGMSGAPVIAGDGVIGVLSGSISEGGTIGWAIPIRYLSELKPIDLRVSEIRMWPDLSAMRSAFRGSTRRFVVSRIGEEHLERCMDRVSRLSRASDQLHRRASKLVASIRHFKRRVHIVSGTDGQSLEGVREFLRPSVESMERSLSSFKLALDHYADSLQLAISGVVDLSTWATRESSIGESELEPVGILLEQTNLSYHDLNLLFHETIGVSESDFREVLAGAFRSTGALSDDPEVRQRQLRKISEFLNAVEGIVGRYTTPESLEYLRAQVAKFRGITAAFSSVVYVDPEG